MSNCNIVGQYKAELLTIQPIFTALLSRMQFYTLYSSELGVQPPLNLEKKRSVIVARNAPLRF